MRKTLCRFAYIVTLTACAPLFPDASSSGSCCDRLGFNGEPLDLDCQNYPAAYNIPAAIQVNQRWTGFVDASFIYWYASESELSIAESALLNTNGTVIMPFKSSSLSIEGEYHPGFKVGTGVTYCGEWTIAGEYTWFRAKTSKHRSAPTNRSSLAGTGVWNVDDWFQQTTLSTDDSLSGTSIDARWKLGLDLADLNLSRPFYEGTHLTVRPHAGLRAAWIRQSVKVLLTQAPDSEGGSSNLPPQPLSSLNHSNSWAIGPRMGFEAFCLLPKRWRLEAACAGSLLATCFTKVYHSEEGQSLAIDPGPYRIIEKNRYRLCPNAEMSLGIGWGKYICPRGHIDFSASYEFNVFWNENAIRSMLDNFWAGMGNSPGDLYFHGLTVKGRFDF